MSQVNSGKDSRNKQAKCLVQNWGQTTLINIKSSSYSRPRTTILRKFKTFSDLQSVLSKLLIN